MTLSVLVPYRPDGGHRDKAWARNKARWAALSAEVIVKSPGEGESPAEFNHPRAINLAAEEATGDIFCIADADTTFDSPWLVREAVRLIRSGEAHWVLPRYYRKHDSDGNVEWEGDSVNWSGLVFVPRDAFELVGGYDERFVFWGADDICFGLTVDALWGRHTRLEGAAEHSWHPTPPEHNYGHRRHPEQDALMRRYIEAAEDPDAIEAVRFG